MSPPIQQQLLQPQVEAEAALARADPEAFDLSGPALARAMHGPLSGKGNSVARKQQHIPATSSVQAKLPASVPTGEDAGRVGAAANLAATQVGQTGVRCIAVCSFER